MTTRWMGVAALALIGLLGYWIVPGLMIDVSVARQQFPWVLYDTRTQNWDITFKRTPPRHWTPIETVSEAAIKAIVISEDWAFYQHDGLDLGEVSKVLEEGLKTGEIKRGASTITQQVARNLFLSQERSVVRKLREAIVAIRLDRTLSKKRILELYLNIAEWGQGIFGIGLAARHYFDKDPSQLNVKEGAFLAMLLPSPKKYSSSFTNKELSPYAQKTIHSIIDKLAAVHFLSAEERALYLELKLSFEN